MIIKWRRVKRVDKRWIDELIGYSKTNKEHLEFLSIAEKYLHNKETIRIIIENGEI